LRTLAVMPATGSVSAALRALLTKVDPGFKIARFEDVRRTTDSRGRSWVVARAIPAEAGFESPNVLAVREDGRWKLEGYGTDVVRATCPGTPSQLWTP
jgi:hypothetical protein